jgi:hypothetical protein
VQKTAVAASLCRGVPGFSGTATQRRGYSEGDGTAPAPPGWAIFQVARRVGSDSLIAMKKSLPVLLLVLCFALRGPGILAAGKPSGLEGEYLDESDGSTLTVTADHWITKGAIAEDDELYTAKKTGDNSYEIVFTFTLPAMKGQTLKATARQEGNFLFVKLEGSRTEVKWKRK